MSLINKSRRLLASNLVVLIGLSTFVVCPSVRAQDGAGQPQYWPQNGGTGFSGNVQYSTGQNPQYPQPMPGQYPQAMPGSAFGNQGNMAYPGGQYPQAMPGSAFGNQGGMAYPGGQYPQAMPGSAFGNQGNMAYPGGQYPQAMPGANLGNSGYGQNSQFQQPMPGSYPDTGSMPYPNGQYQQAMPGANYGNQGNSMSSPMGMGGAAAGVPMQPGFANSQYGQASAGMPGFGMQSPQAPGASAGHPLLNLLKSALVGGAASQMGGSAPQQQSSPGGFGIFKTLFGPPANAQEAQSRAQDDLNTAENQKQQAIDSKNSISGESDKSVRRSLASDAQSHAHEARAASDRVYALSNQFPNSSQLSDIGRAGKKCCRLRPVNGRRSTNAGGGW